MHDLRTLFQSQQDIEARINEILSKIAILQSAQQTASQIAPAAKSAEVDAAKYQKKLDELEAQLSGLTRDRLDYLEKLHQQQLDVQVSVSHITLLKQRITICITYTIHLSLIHI